MKKRFFIPLLAILIILTTIVPTSAASSSIEAPQKVNTRIEDGSILLRWTVPQSIIDYNEEWTNVLYCIDWKVNDGPWHFDVPAVQEDTYDFDEDAPYIGWFGNLGIDEENVQEIVVTHWAVGLDHDIDFINNVYAFRMRFVYADEDGYKSSSYSNDTSVGKTAGAVAPKALEAPKGLSVEVKKKEDGSPYFSLKWTNVTSVNQINENVPIFVKTDYKVGNGLWHSEKVVQGWWSGEQYASSSSFDPVEKELESKIEIEENTYYFRILYAYEPYEAADSVYSPFSNIVAVGVEPFSRSWASDWAIAELTDGAQLGLLTDKIKGNMKGNITREEFAEVAVLFYEKMTGKKAVPAPASTFKDCTNPEVLKAFSLGITTGVGNDNFAPNNLLPRQQMAAMITRTVDACFDNFVLDVSGVEDFKDQALIKSWAAKETKFMAKYKITLGDGKGNFLPEDNCTREQAIAFLVRSYNYRDQYLPK